MYLRYDAWLLLLTIILPITILVLFADWLIEHSFLNPHNPHTPR